MDSRERQVCLASAVRTPQGRFGGALATVPAAELAERVMTQSCDRIGVDLDAVDLIVLGQVYQTPDAVNIARFAALTAGFPVSIPAYTVQMVCCSGMEAIFSGFREIATDAGDVVIAGGVESMSRAPYLLYDARWGMRRGHGELRDMLEEASWSASSYRYGEWNMGLAAEFISEHQGITREDQDAYALRSHEAALEAIDKGRFDEEIVPIQGKSGLVARDEGPRRDTSMSALAHLRPAFSESGSVTAGNSSLVSDGASAIIMMSRKMMMVRGLPPLATIEGIARVAVEPRWLGKSPGLAALKLMEQIGWSRQMVDVWEINEAFAAVVLASVKELQVDIRRVNVNGGGIALGHPVGCSGARIVTSMVHELRRRGGGRGIATVGGGGGVATAIAIRVEEEA